MKLKKGSAAAKAFMAKLRAAKGKPKAKKNIPDRKYQKIKLDFLPIKKLGAAKSKYKYIIQDSEAGNFIDEYITLNEAKKALLKFENQDKKEGIYKPYFYEIKNLNNKNIVGAVKKAAKKKVFKQTGGSNKVYDKRIQAKKPGKRKTSWGTKYTETRTNRSDKGRLLGVGAVQQSEIDFWIKMFAPRKRSTQLEWYRELINSFKNDKFNVFTPKEKGEAQLRALEFILNKKPLQIK